MAFWLLNADPADISPATAVELLGAGRWDIGSDEPHRESVAAGDEVLIYLAAPERVFIGRAAVGSVSAPGPDGRRRVLLAAVETWDPPVAIAAVLARIAPENNARADFDRGLIAITPDEFAAALAVAAAR